MSHKLNPAEIKALAPQIYTESPIDSVSAKYSFLPTFQIIEDMEKLGWFVSDAKAMTSKNPVQLTYGKHLVKFYNPEIAILDENGEVEAYPEVLIINNHRGWGRLRFEIGVFRLICSNGLVIKDKDLGSFNLRHFGYSFGELQQLVNNAVGALPVVVGRINAFTEKVMTEDEIKNFVTKAAAIRFGEDAAMTEEELVLMVESTRKEDEGNTLWKVFNRVQEHLTHGGFVVKNKAGKQRKVRKITNMLADVELNQNLWEMATQFTDYELVA